MEKKVYILILNYNGHLDTIECLESCFKLNYFSFQIIIVDNSPSDESKSFIKNWAEGKIEVTEIEHENLVYPLTKKPVSLISLTEEESNTVKRSFKEKIILITANENKGFAAGNNVGLKFILNNNDADYIWLLNNDTVVESGTLTQLVDTFNRVARHKKLGLLGCTLLDYKFPYKVQGIGGKYNELFSTTKHLGAGKSLKCIKTNFSILKNEVDYIIGASLFTSTNFIKDVGLLNEEYFLYFEELDWKKRGEEKGYTIDTCTASVYHKEGASINQNKRYKNEKSLLADFYSNRNRIIFTKNFFPKYLPLVYLSFTIVLLNRLKRKQFQRFSMILNLIIKPNTTTLKIALTK